MGYWWCDLCNDSVSDWEVTPDERCPRCGCCVEWWETTDYTKERIKKLEILCGELVDALSKLDCGDNACLFAKEKTGMRTNGGCRCIKNLPTPLRLAIERIWWTFKTKEVLEDEKA